MVFQPVYSITPLMLRQLKAIESTCGFLAAVREREDWANRLRNEARIQDAVSSVSLETREQITYTEAFALLDALPDRQLSDVEQEFLNYIRAFDAIDDLRGQRDVRLGRGDLCNIHRLLVDGVRGGSRFAGRLRQEEVQVVDRDVDGEVTVQHQPPPHWEVEARIDELFDWIAGAKKKTTKKAVLQGKPDLWEHPVFVAGIAQHRLAWIHPFVDGNGRTARMLTTLLLHQRGYDFKLLFDLSSYYNHNRDAYYEALRTTDATGDYTHWLMYFTGGLARQMVGVRQKALKCAQSLTETA